MEPHVSLITLGVSNLERAVAFYRDGLGLPMREGDTGVAFFQLRGLWLALFPREALAEDAGVSSAGQGFTGIALAHNVRTNEEVDVLLGQAVAAGGLLAKAGQPAFWGGIRDTSPTLTATSGKSLPIPRCSEPSRATKAVGGPTTVLVTACLTKVGAAISFRSYRKRQ